jgi:hypothetical protein
MRAKVGLDHCKIISSNTGNKTGNFGEEYLRIIDFKLTRGNVGNYLGMKVLHTNKSVFFSWNHLTRKDETKVKYI